MSYVTGNTIRTLRIKHGITQKELAEKLNVSDKTISKWETEKGLPDISIVEELAKALHVSLTELFTGDLKTNENVSGNIKRIQFYVCLLYTSCCKWSRYECSKSNGNSVDVASRIIFFPVDACMRNLWIEWKIL